MQQLIKAKFTLSDCLNSIGKKLSNFRETELSDWFLNTTDTQLAVSFNCKYVAVSYLNKCYVLLPLVDDEENMRHHLIDLDSACKYEG